MQLGKLVFQLVGVTLQLAPVLLQLLTLLFLLTQAVCQKEPRTPEQLRIENSRDILEISCPKIDEKLYTKGQL